MICYMDMYDLKMNLMSDLLVLQVLYKLSCKCILQTSEQQEGTRFDKGGIALPAPTNRPQLL